MFPIYIYFGPNAWGPVEQNKRCDSTQPKEISPCCSHRIPCSSARRFSHLGRRSSDFLSFLDVISGDSLLASRADLVHTDPLKAQDGYSLEKSSRRGERASYRSGGAVPAGRAERQDTAPKLASVEDDFAGKESEPSAGDSQDGQVEQSTAGGHEQRGKIAQFQALISGLSAAKIFRDLGLPDVNAIKLPAMTSAIRSTIELSQGNPGPRALSTGNFRSAVGESSFSVTTLKYSNPCSFLANGDGSILTVAGDVHTEDSRHVTHVKDLEPVH